MSVCSNPRMRRYDMEHVVDRAMAQLKTCPKDGGAIACDLPVPSVGTFPAGTPVETIEATLRRQRR